MYRIRRFTLTTPYHLRFFSQSATAAASLTYLEGFPKPGPIETIVGVPRANDFGWNTSGPKPRLIPCLVLDKEDAKRGGNERLLAIRSDRIKDLADKFGGSSFFYSRLYSLEVRPGFSSDEIIEKVRGLPLLVWFNVTSQMPISASFVRAPSDALLKVDVPIVYIGEDVSPGRRKDLAGPRFNIIKRTVKLLCPADIIPPYIEVDLSKLDVGQKLVMGDLNLHPGLQLIQRKEQLLVKVMASRASGQRRSK